MEYPKDLWFMSFKREEGSRDNRTFNLGGILKKMRLINELKIWCGEKQSIDSDVIIYEAMLIAGGWKKISSEVNKDAKDLKGKKFKMKIIETIIRRTDSNWREDG